MENVTVSLITQSGTTISVKGLPEDASIIQQYMIENEVIPTSWVEVAVCLESCFNCFLSAYLLQTRTSFNF
jgi:hypothetical protein